MKVYIQTVRVLKMDHFFCCGRGSLIRDPDLFLNQYATI